MESATKKICPSCNYSGRDADSNCPYCGLPLISACPACEAPIKVVFAKFCYNCGISFRQQSDVRKAGTATGSQ